MNTVQYLDAVKAKLKLPSDFAIAETLRLTRSAVSAYRTKGTTLGDDVATAVGWILGIPKARVLADMQLERRGADGRQFELEAPPAAPARPAARSRRRGAARSIP
jgi:hypothetical protein